MSEENKAIVRRLFDEFNKRNLTVVDELCDANYIGHVTGGDEIRGPEGLKQSLTAFFSAFPDLHDKIEDLVAEGDKVVARGIASGTHQGEFRGIAPTGKETTVTWIGIYRIVGGKLVEEWLMIDALGMMQQLGVIPTL